MKRVLTTVFFCLLMISCGLNEEEALQLNQYKSVQETFVSASNPLPSLQTFIDNDAETSLKQAEKQKVKEIKEGIFQTVVTEIGENKQLASVNFFTWKKENDQVILIDQKYFNDDEQRHGLIIGENYFELWNEETAFFLSYHDLTLEREFLEEAKQGKMYSSPITTGTTKEQLISIKGEPVISDWYHGGTYYFYNDIGYILDDSMQVVAIQMPGDRISITLKEVPMILGEPTTITYDEGENTVFYSYEQDLFSLSFEAVHEEKKVKNIWLLTN